MRVIIVSNRLPINIERKSNGEWSFRGSSGGLVAALSGAKVEGMVWAGWPGLYLPDKKDREKVEAKLLKEYASLPVWLPEGLQEDFYNGFCNGMLWPLFHYLNTEKFSLTLWKAYKTANKTFVKSLLPHLQPEDLIWVHDYHLMLFPKYLKEKMPQAKIGFFLHIPFPSSEVYITLPEREKLLSSVLHSDLIGFHTHEYARHFLSSCTRVLGCETSANSIQVGRDRTVLVGVFPVGMEPKKFYEKLETVQVKERLEQLKKVFAGKKVIIGVDRLDYIKGIPLKLKGFREFLRQYPEYVGQVVLVQLAVPSRTDVKEYQKLKREIDELVGGINSEFGSVGFHPIVYLFKSIDMTELCAYYRLADTCLITSIRDGMNLVSMEYASCQENKNGPLILSEFTGASLCLSGVIRINPWNSRDVSDAIYKAFNMPEEEKASRQRNLMSFIEKCTSEYWGKSYLLELSRVSEQRASKLDTVHTLLLPQHISSLLKDRQNRLIILCYDYLSSKKDQSSRRPAKRVLRQLKAIAANKANRLLILSGMDMKFMDKWFSDIGADMVSEYFFLKTNGTWSPLLPGLDSSWKETFRPIFHYYANRTPGSLVEDKTMNITWHYGNSQPEFGMFQMQELLSHLEEMMGKRNCPHFDYIKSDAALELRPRGVNEQLAVRKYLEIATDIDVVLFLGNNVKPDIMASDHTKGSIQVQVEAEPQLSKSQVHGLFCSIGTKENNYYLNDDFDLGRIISYLAEHALAENENGQLSDQEEHTMPPKGHCRSASDSVLHFMDYVDESIDSPSQKVSNAALPLW